MNREPEHCEKHSEYESWCLSCVCAEESYLEDENERLHARIAELVAENERMRTKLGSVSVTLDQNEGMKNAFVDFAEIVKMRCDTPLEISILATRLLIAYQNDEPYED